jgi:hypothetical protein
VCKSANIEIIGSIAINKSITDNFSDTVSKSVSEPIKEHSLKILLVL